VIGHVPGTESLHQALLKKTCEHSGLNIKPIRERHAHEWQPDQPPSLKSSIPGKNQSRNNGTRQKCITPEQNDIPAIRWLTEKQMTRAHLAAQPIRNERHNQAGPE